MEEFLIGTHFFPLFSFASLRVFFRAAACCCCWSSLHRALRWHRWTRATASAAGAGGADLAGEAEEEATAAAAAAVAAVSTNNSRAASSRGASSAASNSSIRVAIRSSNSKEEDTGAAEAATLGREVRTRRNSGDGRMQDRLTATTTTKKNNAASPSPSHTLDSTHANLPRSPLLAPSLPPGGYRGRGGAPRGGGGRGAGGRGPAGAPFDGQPEDIDFLKVLRGHSRQVTAAVIDPSTQRLYTGSQDGTVRCWLMAESDGSGTPGPVVDVGGEVDSLLLEGGFLFVGLHGPPPQRPGTIKAFNLASGASCSLEGHVGQVLCLACATGTGTLLSGGQDATIRAWAFDEATSAFVAAGVLAAAQGGHSSPVQALAPAGQFLVSGDWEGTLKVWDLASGACAQTIPRAHPSVVMGCLTWEGHVLSAGLDGAIKVWAPVEGAPGPGKVLEPAPMYSHPPADSRDRSGSGTGEPGRSAAADGGAPSPSGFGGILALGGTVDAKGGALVAASHADDGQVRLWELPSFAEKGSLGGVADARALAASPGGVVAVGDKRGNVKVWRWKTG